MQSTYPLKITGTLSADPEVIPHPHSPHVTYCALVFLNTGPGGIGRSDGLFVWCAPEAAKRLEGVPKGSKVVLHCRLDADGFRAGGADVVEESHTVLSGC
jgi:hypothetical protein